MGALLHGLEDEHYAVRCRDAACVGTAQGGGGASVSPLATPCATCVQVRTAAITALAGLAAGQGGLVLSNALALLVEMFHDDADCVRVKVCGGDATRATPPCACLLSTALTPPCAQWLLCVGCGPRLPRRSLPCVRVATARRGTPAQRARCPTHSCPRAYRCCWTSTPACVRQAAASWVLRPVPPWPVCGRRWLLCTRAWSGGPATTTACLGYERTRRGAEPAPPPRNTPRPRPNQHVPRTLAHLCVFLLLAVCSSGCTARTSRRDACGVGAAGGGCWMLAGAGVPCLRVRNRGPRRLAGRCAGVGVAEGGCGPATWGRPWLTYRRCREVVDRLAPHAPIVLP